MPDVFILADSLDSATPPQLASLPWMEMKRVILAAQSAAQPESVPAVPSGRRVEVLFTKDLDAARSQIESQVVSLCPLTLNLPDWCQFPGRGVFAACAEIEAVRQQVAAWQVAVGNGTYWQPIVFTAKGALFAEAIAPGAQPERPYAQPFHLEDAIRQPLYALGQRLLQALAAVPGVYLMQFGLSDRQIWFDRLIPFPDLPAIASVGVQMPDLFDCHWRCLTQQPIRDLHILS